MRELQENAAGHSFFPEVFWAELILLTASPRVLIK